jgi:hypothetical protein
MMYSLRFHIKGPFGRAFPSASPLASTEALPNPYQKTASKLKSWRSHFAICTTEVKPKIVASRGFFPTCDIEATTTAILPNTLENGFSFKKNHFTVVATATAVLATAEALPKGP